MNYDVIVIGAGVTGCAIARELSRYCLSVCVLEKYEDVCSGTSKANSGIVHAGFDAKPGTMKAKMNVEGCRIMPELARELDIDYKNNTALVLAFSDSDRKTLQELLERGEKNGVEALRIVERDELLQMEPNIADGAIAALYAPTGGIVCPFSLTIALAENACENGVEFRFNSAVTDITAIDGGWQVTAGDQVLSGRYVINAAGVYADVMHNMVSADRMTIHPRKGDYILLDKKCGRHVSATIFQVPGKLGKGILVTPTAHGNLMLGPTATDIDDKNDTATTADELSAIIERSRMSVKDIPYNMAITSFSGVRACPSGGDFILGEVSDAPGFFDAAGIESPGLTSAPAIGRYIAGMVAEKANAKMKAGFIAGRRGIPRTADMSREEYAQVIAKDPLYGKIVCRCEQISEGEIRDAIHRPLGAHTPDGIKRRVRAGMGRCQAGFCTPRILEILSGELGIPMTQIRKNSEGSEMIQEKI